MRFISRKILMLLTALFLTLSTFATEGVFAVNEKQAIKIGYCENYGTIIEDAPADRRGYGYEYFNRLAQNTNIELRFIKCRWEDAFTMLENGEIDVFGPIQKTKEREERYGFPDESFGYEHGLLLAHKDKPIYYEDFLYFNNMKVGTVDNTYFMEAMKNYCEENNFQVGYVFTQDSSAYNGLKNGLYDAILIGSLTILPDTKVVAKIATEPFYYVTRKEDIQTLKWINSGMKKILHDDVYFPSSLHQKYYGEQESNHAAFTKDEIQLAFRYNKLKVSVAPDNLPLQYFDPTIMQFKGISVDLIQQAAKNCGLEVEFISADAITPQSQIDIYAAGAPGFAEIKAEKSKPYYSASMVLVSTHYQSDWRNLTVALPKLYKDSTYRLLNRYPSLNIKHYDTVESAIQAVKTKETDFVFLTSNIFESLIRLYPSETFAMHQTDIKMPMHLLFSNELPEGIVGLFNKGISATTQSQLDAIVFSNTALIKKEFSFTDLINLYSYEIVVAAIFAFTVLLALVILIVYMQGVLKKSAYTDEITGAYTFLKFKQEAAEILKNASPYQYALISIDIDNFKYINSIFGYEIGNEVLRAVYQSSKEYLDHDTIVARINADKFVFLTNTHKYSAPSLVYSSEKILNSKIQELLGEFYNLALSIGVYTIENPAEDLSIMLDWANIANKNSKNHYGSRLVLFTNEMKKDLKNRRDITVDKERAMDNNEFIAFFQPKYDLKTLEICGAEMLVRWKKGEKLIPPCDFIPVFEQNGFIKKLDLFMFQKVCTVISKWKHTYRKAVPKISVNLSPVTFTSELLTESLIQITEKCGVDAADIEIEITESVLMHDVRKVREILSKLRKAGFAIAIDDFGSRYSSLNALKDLPVDVIKLDREFISHGFSDAKVCTIVSSVINMAKELNLETVAEGIETQEQAQMLKSFGCDVVQGYYFSRPISQKDFETLYFT